MLQHRYSQNEISQHPFIPTTPEEKYLSNKLEDALELRGLLLEALKVMSKWSQHPDLQIYADKVIAKAEGGEA